MTRNSDGADIGLAWVEYCLAEKVIDNIAATKAFGFAESFVETKLGFRELRHLLPDQDPTAFVAGAARSALERHDVDANSIDCLVFVTQTPLNRGIPHGSALLHRDLGLKPGAACFDIGLGCSGFVYALAAIQSFMSLNDYKNGLIVTFDPYARIVDPTDRDVAVIFSDGAAVAFVTREAPVWRAESYDFGTCGAEYAALQRDEHGCLRMNGRQVFNFCAMNVPQSIRAVAGDGLDRVDRFVLHQGSKFIVDTIAQRLGVADRAPFVAADYGNIVSSSVPAAFVDAVQPTDETVVISGFGVGLSWGSALLRRVRES